MVVAEASAMYPDPTTWNLQSFRNAVHALPAGTLSREDLLVEEFLLGRDNQVSVFYAPFDATTPDARVVLVGLTPGWTQMRLAFEACRDALVAGQSDAEASRGAKATASFAGMRDRISKWLDELGVQSWLGLTSTSSLFEDPNRQMHTTSAVRYPTFVGDDYVNYRGVSPRPDRSVLLSTVVAAKLVPELGELPDALIVPMGTAVARILEVLEVAESSRCLYGFPHPSGANGWANRQFAEHQDGMREKVRSLH